MANEVRNEAIEYAKSQFDAAFRRLEAAQSRLQALAADPGGDEAALGTARASYDQARLLWLCSEAALRSAAIVAGHARQTGRRVVILQGNSHVAESIALLLRLRGFRATVMSRDPAHEDKSSEPAAAVLMDFERKRDHADQLALGRLNVAPATRVIAMVPHALLRQDWDGFDAVLLKPASIDMIVQMILGDTPE